jgi:hypothetical protein
MQPLREGVVDLRKVGGVRSGSEAERLSVIQFVQKYALFFAFTGMCGAALILATWFIGEARQSVHSFEMQPEAPADTSEEEAR